MYTRDFKKTLFEIARECQFNKIAQLFAIDISNFDFLKRDALSESILEIYEGTLINFWKLISSSPA
jgi:hypothetical protein